MARRTAVVIDDEVDLTTYISSILEENEIEVRTANDATAGEALIREQVPDIVLIDLMMPGRSGVQLFSRLRRDQTTGQVPVVMVTGIREKMGIDWGEYADDLKARKPEGFVEKPIEPAGLMQVVNGVLAGEAKGGKVLHA
jgi:two-component system phosphate regulon response regulator PhoB